MITKQDLGAVLKGYDLSRITIGSLGGHSALDVCRGAKDEGFRTVVVCQKGRENTYARHFRARNGKGVVDGIILVDSFADVTNPGVQEQLRALSTVFIHSRYFWVYCNFGDIEEKFRVPIFGTRGLMRAEERNEKNNQYFLLEKAGIRTPKRFNDPKDIDRLVIVKAAEAERSYERGFFYVSNYDEYVRKSRELIAKGIISESSLNDAVIEEFVLGPQVNLNFFYSPLSDEVELLGTDTRRQANIDGLLRLSAPDQVEVLKSVVPRYVESGHYAVTLKESLLEKAFAAGERFVAAAKEFCPPGIIGPFALQGAVALDRASEEFVIFDCSLRIPGSPGTKFTPYSGYLYGREISVGRRISMELRAAIGQGRLLDVVT